MDLLAFAPVTACLPLETSVHSLFEAADFQGSRVLLESARVHPVTGRYSILAGEPSVVLTAKGNRIRLETKAGARQWEGDSFLAAQALLDSQRTERRSGLPPFLGGAIGAVGFDACRILEDLPAQAEDDLDFPDLTFLFFSEGAVVDHFRRKLWVFVLPEPGDPRKRRDQAVERLGALVRRFTRSAGGDTAPPPSASTEGSDSRPSSRKRGSESGASFHGNDSGRFRGNDASLSSTHSRAEFERMVRRAKEFIAAGEIYQANLSQRFSVPCEEDPWVLYRRLTRINPSPFAAFADFGSFQVVSASPERLLRRQGGRLETRPIAGTRPRGQTAVESARLRRELILNEKERAEHLMLLDLERNDLGRVCRYGSVEVDDFMGLEEYSHVIHIVSNVRGKMRPGVGLRELLTATFPGGTISGCPKIRSLEIIDALEPVRRQLYAGSLGYFSATGEIDLNILIRTAFLSRGQATVHAGAGIVADSDPSREYDETLHKARALLEALGAGGPDVILTPSEERGKDLILKTRSLSPSGVSG